MDLRSQLSAWLDLARIASVRVPGLIEEVRLFNGLACIRGACRLAAEHLNACLVLAAQHMLRLADFSATALHRRHSLTANHVFIAKAQRSLCFS
eukprot:1160172-Pelagomonas_calceolata.AAC.4